MTQYSKNFDFLKEQHEFNLSRLIVICVCISIGYIILILRLFHITLIRHDFWLDKREKRFIYQPSAILSRKQILDKNEYPLAINIPRYSVGWYSSYKNKITYADVNILKEYLNIPDLKLEKLTSTEKKFIPLKRKVHLRDEEITLLRKIKGIQIITEDKRYYPLGAQSAQLIGFTDIDSKGIDGFEQDIENQAYIEKKFDSFYKDSKGRFIKKHIKIDDHNEKNIKITIDSRVQSLLYKHLKEAFDRQQVDSFSAVLINTDDTSIVASLSYPSFNPNDSLDYNISYKLKPLVEHYEPGSVMKPFSVACVLDANQDAKDFHTDIRNGFMMLDGHKISDVHARDVISFDDILIYSSNVGLTKLLQKNKEFCNLHDCLKNFGFNEHSGIEMMAESQPNYPLRIKKGSFPEATLSFGYGLQTNLFQLAKAYASFANKGFLRDLTLYPEHIQKNKLNERKVIKSETADDLLLMLEKVVVKGSAKNAYLDTYRIGGKTGTAKKVGVHGYEDSYHSFFAAIFPLEHPKYVLVIHADNPRGKIYGGQVCAPIAKKIIPYLLSLSEKPTYCRNDVFDIK